MIKLSKLTDYAVVILAALVNANDERYSAADLAARTALPEPTVAKVLKILARGDILTSVRGAKGGYALHKQPHEIRVSEIITVMEGPIALTSCVDGSDEQCAIQGLCAMNGRWNVVNAAIKTALENVTLADILPPAAAKTVKSHAEEESVRAYE